MLDSLIREGSKLPFSDFISTYGTDIINNWKIHISKESISGTSTYKCKVFQYILAFYYVSILKNKLLTTNNFESISESLNFINNRMALNCIGVNIHDILDIFNLSLLWNSTYLKEDKPYIEFTFEVLNSDTVTMDVYGNVLNTYADWGEGHLFPISVTTVSKALTPGIYKLRLCGDKIQLIDIYKIEFDSSANWVLLDCHIPSYLTNLYYLSLKDNKFKTKTVDDIVITLGHNAVQHNITGGTLDLSSSESEDITQPLSSSSHAICVLDNTLGWTVDIPGFTFTCSNYY